MRADWPIRLRLVDCLKSHPLLAGCSITSTPPMDLSTTSEHLWVDATSGDTLIGPNVTGRQINDTEFTLTLRALTKKGGTHERCMARMAEILGAVYDVIADGERDGLPLVDWGVDGDWDCHEVTPGSYESTPGTDTQDGSAFASGEVDVDFEVRYFGGNQ